MALRTAADSVLESHLAVSANGDAFIAWGEQNMSRAGTPYELRVASYTPVLGWLPSELVSKGLPNTTNSYSISVAVDPEGRAAVGWVEQDFSPNGSYDFFVADVNRYTPGAGWGGVEEVFNTSIPTQVSYMVLAMGSGGEVFASAEIDDTNYSALQAVRYAPAGGWTAPVDVVNSTGGTHPLLVAVAALDGGGALVDWLDQNLSGWLVSTWASAYTPGAGWGVPQRVDDGSSFPDLLDTVATGGEVAVLCTKYVSNATVLYTRSYRPSTGWTPAVTVSNNSSALSGRLVADAGGNWTAVWLRYNASGDLLWSSRLAAGGAWSAAAQLPDLPGGARQAGVAPDGAGGAVAVWPQDSGGHTRVYASHFVPLAGWGPAVALSPLRTLVDSVGVGARGSGAFASWMQDNGAQTDIEVAQFTRAAAPVTLEVATPGAGFVNSTLVNLSGTTDPGNLVFVEGEAVPVSGSGAFSTLRGYGEGAHTAVVVATDLDGNSRTASVSFTVDTHLEFALTAPAEGASVVTPTVVVSGTSEPGATISINGAPVVPSPNGSFSAAASLVPGPNAVVVAARDRAGNAGSVRVNVTFIDPAPAIEARLAALQNDSAAASAALAASQANLTDAQAKLALQAAQLDAAKAKADLATAEASSARNDASSAMLVAIVALAIAGAAVGLAVFAMRRPPPKPPVTP